MRTTMQLTTLLPLWRAGIAADHTDRSVRSYAEHVERFLRQLGAEATITSITAPAIETHKQRLSRSHAPRTVALALTAIRSFIRWQIASELRQDDPTLKVRFPKAPKPLPRALSDDQVRELLAALIRPSGLLPAADEQWRRNALAIRLLLYTGMRISELGSLRWRDVDLAQRRLVVRGGKGEKDRTIPIHMSLLGELRLAAVGRRPSDAVCGHAHGPALSLKSWHHVFERWVPALGLSFHLTAHPLRHTFITALIDRGANIFEAQELAGHESPETTRLYYRLSGKHLREAIDRLPATW